MGDEGSRLGLPNDIRLFKEYLGTLRPDLVQFIDLFTPVAKYINAVELPKSIIDGKCPPPQGNKANPNEKREVRDLSVWLSNSISPTVSKKLETMWASGDIDVTNAGATNYNRQTKKINVRGSDSVDDTIKTIHESVHAIIENPSRALREIPSITIELLADRILKKKHLSTNKAGSRILQMKDSARYVIAMSDIIRAFKGGNITTEGVVAILNHCGKGQFEEIDAKCTTGVNLVNYFTSLFQNSSHFFGSAASLLYSQKIKNEKAVDKLFNTVEDKTDYVTKMRTLGISQKGLVIALKKTISAGGERVVCN
jgi:hypothetical protein